MQRFSSFGLVSLISAALVVITAAGHAQQTTLIVPQGLVSDSFYESIGINWGLRGNGPGGGWFFQNGGGAPLPGFGGFVPGSGASFGFGASGPQGGYHFHIFGSQGSSRSFTSSSAMLTLPNGGVGSIQAGSWVPFVTGWVPVVGDGQPLVVRSPLKERLERLQAGETGAPSPRSNGHSSTRSISRPATTVMSDREVAPAKFVALSQGGAGQLTPTHSHSSANHGDISVAEIRRQNALADEARQEEIAREVTRLVAMGQDAEEQRKFGAARTFYRQAFNRASGELRRAVAERLERLPKS
ncbi:MAG: hypothetical protein ACKOBW_17865 [Planctomycetota bacterium]